MAVVLRVVSDSLGRPEYAALMRALDLDGATPAGQLLHLASEGSDGRIEIVELWQTPEAARGFVEQRLEPALVALGLEGVGFEIRQSLGVFTPELDTLERIGAHALPGPIPGPRR